MHRLDRTAKLRAAARFDFDKCDFMIASHDEIDVAPAFTKPVMHNGPSLSNQPTRGDSFAKQSEFLS